MVRDGFDVNDGGEFARRAASDRVLENNIRHLLADQVLEVYKDPHLANHMRLVIPNPSVAAPDWLMSMARDHSSAVYRQQQRTNAFWKSAAAPNNPQGGKGGGKKGGRGK